MSRHHDRTRSVGNLAVFATPWARGAMTEAEWDTLRSLAIEGSIGLYGKSARGPFTIRLNVVGMPEVRASGGTVAAAIAAAVGAVAA